MSPESAARLAAYSLHAYNVDRSHVYWMSFYCAACTLPFSLKISQLCLPRCSIVVGDLQTQRGSLYGRARGDDGNSSFNEDAIGSQSMRYITHRS